MTDRSIRFGLIGTGRIGQVHAANIAASDDTQLSWICDPFLAGAEAVAARYGGHVTESAEELIGSGEIDALLIASPTPTHVDLIAAGVTAGLPVLCEKPIDLDITRVDGLRPVVEAARVPVALGFNRRFDPSFAAARARVKSGEIGGVEQVTIISRDPAAPPEDYIAVSGGIFRDMTIHDFDMARFFVGGMVEVAATGGALFDPGARQHGDLDTAVTTLRSASGALVVIINSRHSSVGYDQRIEVFGTEGSISVANAPTSLVSVSRASGVETKTRYQDFFLERYADAYRAELAEFVKLVRGEESACPTFEDGRAALLLADAAQRSVLDRSSQAISA